jgi:hypothetical protein
MQLQHALRPQHALWRSLCSVCTRLRTVQTNNGLPSRTSAWLLSTLYMATNDTAHISSTMLHTSLANLLVAALQPLVSSLEAWMTKGVLDDPCEEFMVVQCLAAQTDQTPSEDHWQSTFCMRVNEQMRQAATQSPGSDADQAFTPSFLRQSLHDVIVGGKSAEVFCRLGAMSDLVPACPPGALYDAISCHVSTRQAKPWPMQPMDTLPVETCPPEPDSLYQTNLNRLFAHTSVTARTSSPAISLRSGRSCLL